MSAKVAKILMYLINPLGFLIVFLVNKDLFQDEGVKQHANQALICLFGCILGFLIIPAIAAAVFAIWGLIKAIQDDDTPLPLIGGWRIIK